MLQYRITHVDPGLNVSHLCHNSLCVKVSHVSMELHSVNKIRQYYMAQNICMLWSRGIPPMPVRVEIKKVVKQVTFFRELCKMNCFKSSSQSLMCVNVS